LTTNFKNYSSDRLEKIFLKAKKGAELKTGLSDRFPEKTCYSLAEIIGDNV